MSSDEGKEFIAKITQDFFLRWGVNHRLSAAYNPQSNGRDELAVKSTKRLLEENIGPDGELNTDKFLRAMLIKRNTPDPSTKLSPAEIIFGRKLRDSLPRLNKRENIFFNQEFRATWRDAWKQKELALRARYQGCQKRLEEHSKALPPLDVGDRVAIQNQHGRHPNKWERSGTIMEVRDFDKYVTKVDGSGRLTLRNRRYLKKLYQDNGMFGSPETIQNSHTVPKSTTSRNSATSPPVSSPLCHTIKDAPHVGSPLTQPSPCTKASATPPASPGGQPSTPKRVLETPRRPAATMPRKTLAARMSPTPTESGPSPAPPPVLPPVLPPVRSSRIRKQTRVYDATLGTYVIPGQNTADN